MPKQDFLELQAKVDSLTKSQLDALLEKILANYESKEVAEPKNYRYDPQTDSFQVFPASRSTQTKPNLRRQQFKQALRRNRDS